MKIQRLLGRLVVIFYMFGLFYVSCSHFLLSLGNGPWVVTSFPPETGTGEEENSLVSISLWMQWVSAGAHYKVWGDGHSGYNLSSLLVFCVDFLLRWYRPCGRQLLTPNEELLYSLVVWNFRDTFFLEVKWTISQNSS